MIEYIPFVLTKNMFLAISIYFLVVVMLFWRRNITFFDRPAKPQYLLSFLFLIHLIFAFDGGDFFHYYEFFVEKDFERMEVVYGLIARLVGYNYLWFRVIVWGGALAIFQLTVKRFRLDVSKTTFLLYIMFIGVFDYARATLAMAVYFYGLSYICIPIRHDKFLSYILAAVLIALSIVLHRSMAFTAAMTVMVFLPLNPYVLFLMLVLFSFSAPILNNIFFDYILSGEFIPDEELTGKIIGYANLSYDDRFSIFEWIRRTVSYLTFFLPIIYLAFKIFRKKYHGFLHSSMLRLYKVTVGILLLAVSTLMINVETFVIFYRYLFMAMIPVTILVSYGRKSGMISNRIFKILLFICLTHELFGMAKLLLSGNLS